MSWNKVLALAPYDNSARRLKMGSNLGKATIALLVLVSLSWLSCAATNMVANGQSAAESAVIGSTTRLTLRVQTGRDDAHQKAGSSSAVVGARSIALGDRRDSRFYAGFRFDNVRIPKGALILSARLKVRPLRSYEGRTKWTVGGEDVGDSRPFRRANGPAQRILTRAKAVWKPNSWKEGRWYQSPDLSTVVQEIVDRADWDRGHALTIIVKDRGRLDNKLRKVFSYERNTKFRARLVVRYWAPSPTLGVQMLAEVDDPAAMTLARKGGAHWVRTWAFWARIEPTNTDPTNFNWTTYDQRFANLSAAGLTPIVIIGSNPTWAAEYPCGPITDTNLLDFAEFLTAVVSRYKDPPYNVKYWELYNEPDNGDPINYSRLGGCWGNYGDKYAAMLQVAYPAIKAADPEAKVLLGGLAYDAFESGPRGGPFVESFLDDVLIAGGGNYFDIMNFHYYPAFAQRWEGRYKCAGVRGKGVICKTSYLRGKLATYGVEKPFVCTEIGQGSGEEHKGSEAKQSSYVVQSIVRGTSADLRVINWFTLVDYEEERKWGLLNPDYSPKPAYLAYQTLARELAGVRYIRRLPDEETGSSHIEAYEFTVPSRDHLLWVVWTNADKRTKMDFPMRRLRVVDKFGSETIVIDGQAEDLDGIVNGKVRIWVHPGDPLYASE